MPRLKQLLPVEQVRVSRLIDRDALQRLASGGMAYAECFFVEVRMGACWFALAQGPGLRTFTDFEKADALRKGIEKRHGLTGATA